MITQVDLRPTLSANIRRLRTDLELSQKDLAEKVGVSTVFLNRIEQAKSSPSAELLYSIADALGVPADALRQIPLPAA